MTQLYSREVSLFEFRAILSGRPFLVSVLAYDEAEARKMAVREIANTRAPIFATNELTLLRFGNAREEDRWRFLI